MSGFDQIVDRLRRTARRHVLDALDERGLVRGMRIVFPRPGACELQDFEEARPGPGEVLVATRATIVSPGTERAAYLRLPNVSETYPHTPGYSQSGVVVAAGRGAAFQVGELVASRGSHASLYLARPGQAMPVPVGVPLEHAALTPIAFIALQGVRRARLQPGQRVLVLGAGLVGQLAAQFAALAGAEVTVAARSRARLEVVDRCGLARPVALGSDGGIDGPPAEVVIDATGHPEGVLIAMRAASRGGRIVLLGSPRGVTTGLDAGAWVSAELTLIGAHTGTAPTADESSGAWTYRHEAQTFLRLVTERRLQLDPLITRRAAPDEAPSVYADLAREGDASVAIVFDWSRPGPWQARVEYPSPLRLLTRGARRAAGLPAKSRPAFLAPRPDGRRLRFGLIGCGEIAAENAVALRETSNATITATTDLNADLARSLAAATGAAVARDAAELLARPDVDAVLISTPHDLHAPLAIQAAEAGKHVVVEKPMATRVAECDRMIAAARRHGVTLSVCYCQRFDPRVQAARRLLAAGAIGELLGSHIRFGQWRGDEYWAGGLTGRASGDWRSKRERAGGGVLIMNACHILDYMSWLAGSPVADVVATVATLRHAVEVEDMAALSYRYANGAIGSMEATTTLPGPGLFEQHLWGTHGQLIIAPQLRMWSNRTIEGREGGGWHSIPVPRSAERRHYFEAFAASILDGSPSPVTAEEARAVQATIEAAYRSAETGTRAKVAG